jgi:two-component system OmpR family sensor kinase
MRPQRRALAPRWTVRSRILASILLVALVGMTVAGLTAFLVQRDRIVSQIDDLLVDHVESARFVVTGDSDAVATEPDVEQPPDGVTFTTAAEALEAILARVIPGRNESALGIVDGAATLVPGVDISFHLEDDPAFVRRIVNEASDGGVHLGTAISSVGTVRYVASPVAVEGDPQPAIYVAAVDVDAELDELRAAFGTYTVVAAITLVAIGLVGWMRSPLSLAVMRDDISALTETVNGMLNRLDRAMTSQRQLLDDVRHELKTPITIVRGHLELLEPANVAEVEATRALAIDELDRMTRLVDDIESLAEAQRMTLARTPTDVADLTADVFAKASVIADHEWVMAGAAHVSTSVDAGRITQAWLQLVDNAAKYSPPGSRIDIGSTSDDSTVEFWVADRGRGIPPGAEERIFERFGRADTGRGIDGSGLGLPIVRTIATAHGGRVSLATSPQGSRFGIVVPILDAPQNEDTEAL